MFLILIVYKIRSDDNASGTAPSKTMSNHHTSLAQVYNYITIKHGIGVNDVNCSSLSEICMHHYGYRFKITH